MSQWEYKTLMYGVEGKYVYTLRYWADSSLRAYGPKERAHWWGGLLHQIRQLEEALKELDQEGWELVSARRATSERNGKSEGIYEMIFRRPVENPALPISPPPR